MDKWIIDICRTCGARAVYPFICGHRRSDKEWTFTVVVKPAYPAAYAKDKQRAALEKGSR